MAKASELIKQALEWLGKQEMDGSFKEIIDTYNSHKPLARGYKVKYTDSWCAAFISALAIKCNATDIIPTECSCQKMIDLFKKLGVWIENENRTPNPGDIIFYDWQDDGEGDNKGWSDHVGIVEKVSNGKITVIEGNISNKVGRRTIAINAKCIRGYAAPKYEKEATVEAKPTTPTSTATYGKEQFIREVQDAIGAKVDGIAGDETLSKTVTISRYKNSTHPVVRAVQKYFNFLGYNCGEVDGEAGELFEAAAIAYQQATGCTDDGELTAQNKTWKMLLGMISPTPQKDTTIKVGSKVKVKKGAKFYNGATPRSFVYSNVYDVQKVDGDKVKIGKGNATTGTIHKDNLIVQ